MRILWFTNTPSSASKKLNEKITIGGWMISLEKHLAKINSIELGVAFPYGYSGTDNFKIDRTEYFSFPYPKDKGKILGLRGRLAHNIEPKSEINYYLDIVNKFKPDLIQIFGSERSFGLIIPHINIPVLIHIQGNLTVYEKKWFSGLSSWNIFRYSNLKDLILGYNIWHQYFLFKKRAFREQTIFTHCKYFMGRTDWDRRITKTLAPNSRYFHCDELLREEFFNASWIKPENTKTKLFSIVSSSTYKGIETILETAILLKKHKLLEFEWHIAGISSNDEIVKIIERKTKQKFSDNHTYLKGSLSTDYLLKELMTSNCFVHPSHIENSANSICEAMLIGLPVIATYAGGTPSLINNGEEGLLVQDGDPYALAGAILELINDKDLLNNISQKASLRAKKRHNPEKVVKDLLTIYEAILKEN